MTYGIKHTNGAIEAISRFEGIVASGFIEITKAKYDEFIGIISQNYFVLYDEVANEINVDLSQQSILVNSVRKEDLKKQLKALSTEIDTLERMSEDTTAKQAEFDDLLIEYNRPV